MWWHEYLHMLHDPAHLFFELTVGTAKDLIVFGGGGWVVGRFAIKRHDRNHHGDDS